MKYCFGVDIGGTTVKMGLVRGNGDYFGKMRLRPTQKKKREKQSFRMLPNN